MNDYITNVMISVTTEVILTLIITFAIVAFVLPIIKKVIEMSIPENEQTFHFFIKNYMNIKKITFMIGFAFIAIIIALAFISPTNTGKTDNFDNKAVQERIEKVNKRLSEKDMDGEITTEGVLDPMRNTGEVSKKRILELTSYKTTKETVDDEKIEEDEKDKTDFSK